MYLLFCEISIHRGTFIVQLDIFLVLLTFDGLRPRYTLCKRFRCNTILVVLSYTNLPLIGTLPCTYLVLTGTLPCTNLVLCEMGWDPGTLCVDDPVELEGEDAGTMGWRSTAHQSSSQSVTLETEGIMDWTRNR